MSSSKAKKERRKARHERNILKDKSYKKSAWESGKLIYENHNDGYFSPEYSEEFVERLANNIQNDINQENFLQKYQKYKCHIITGVLRYNPELSKSRNYNLLKFSLETYWDNKDNFKNILLEWIKMN